MRWPFALRSTVDALDAEILVEIRRRDLAESRAADWYDRLSRLQKRFVEVTDLARTTPEVMANVFAEWDSGQQAKFINLFTEISEEWKGSRCMQFAYVMDDLTYEACWALEQLGDHAKEAGSKKSPTIKEVG